MGKKQGQPLRRASNLSLKIGFQGSQITSGRLLIAVFELNKRLGMGELIEQDLDGLRHSKYTQWPLADRLAVERDRWSVS